MQIFTYYNAVRLEGRVIAHSRFFIEVEITAPYQSYVLSRSIPTFARPHYEYMGEHLEATSKDLLKGLYEYGLAREEFLPLLRQTSNFRKIGALSKEIANCEKVYAQLSDQLNQKCAQLDNLKEQIEDLRYIFKVSCTSALENSGFETLHWDLKEELVQELSESA